MQAESFEVSQDYVLTPCPFCGRGSLIVDDAQGQLLHEGTGCPTFLRVETLEHLTAALSDIRKAGYPHGVPEVTGSQIKKHRN